MVRFLVDNDTKGLIFFLGTFYSFNVSVRTDDGVKRSMPNHVLRTILEFGPSRDLWCRIEENARHNHHHHDRFYQGNLTVVNGESLPPVGNVEKYCFDHAVLESIPPLSAEEIQLSQALGRCKRK